MVAILRAGALLSALRGALRGAVRGALYGSWCVLRCLPDDVVHLARIRAKDLPVKPRILELDAST